ncbi:FtsW/RodA/SpoVE family cell cycle protein [Daejeonella sp. JGW-45]|uniref:FtsW/RodA/SpoVE family cell cycle protein n=1 Tax=Daejeonella sp. JGW-45 TaxID=3034148 RepID=UPI0023EAEC28|nr:FtsW/RodA/SpoVE family cell cycle protein [Daejeonella sp. JGW-45]
MPETQAHSASRKFERIFLVLLSVAFGLLFFSLHQVLERDFEDVKTRISDGSMVNLNSDKTAERIQKLMLRGYYFEDKKDIDLIRSVVENASRDLGVIDNIGELNKRRFFVNAQEADVRGGKSFKMRARASRSLLGFTGDDSLRYDQETSRPPSLPSSTDLKSGQFDINGKIKDKDGELIPGVLVRLIMILPQDSVYSDQVAEIDRRYQESANGYTKTFLTNEKGSKQLESLTAYVRTGAQGEFTFRNLPDNKAYQVLPLKPGFQFGSSQGVQELASDIDLTFTQNIHTIRLFPTRDFNILKKEKALIVRTPEEFTKWFWIIGGGFIAGFLMVHVILSIRFPQADQLLLPVLMFLTGISLVTLLSLQDPLRDRFLAKDTLFYLFAGLMVLCILQFINFRKLNPDSRFYRLFFFRSNRKAANGWPWAVLSIALLALMIVFGTGPEGSGVKVNLFGIQPSEIVKFGIILFLAGFFAANEKFISEYRTYRKRWSFFSFALGAILVSILLFLVLGDLGPAMVICFTFIILFSFSRGDFMFMVAAVILYVFTVWLLRSLWLATLVTVTILALAMVFKRKQLSESAVMAILVISGFLLIDQIPGLDKLFPGPVQRLVERKAIWNDAWNNEVYGGDHVANGIWAMSAGGIGGQGIGEGFAKNIPEAHTDMVLPALGEEFGLAGIVCICILFLIYLHRAILIGRQTGTPFLFYLSAGIGISTFVQFLLIAAGSTGALPLSGVSLPLVSYGGSSLLANIAAAGFLLSASKIKGTEVQLNYISKQQDRNLIPALAAAFTGVILLIFNIASYLVNNEKWVVQPSLVADRSGARMFSYNPRINILMNKLQAGSLYDRNGLILVTSNADLIKKQKGRLAAAGAKDYDLDSAIHKRVDRYYPYEEQMFFWTGDANTGIFTGSTNGYFAEYEHAAELRGFNTPVIKFNTIASRYREDRFLPRGVKEMTVTKKDYRELAPLLLAGINSRKVEEFKLRNRDLMLTLDAGLQADLQRSIAKDDSLKDNRVSVVIIEDSTGDVLTSAVYPLPPVKDWDRMIMTAAEQNKLADWMTTSDLGFTYATQPGSTAKILTAMAAFNKLGPAAADKKFQVSSFERIRTKGLEPDETGLIGMERAIVNSNNVYFIKLANEEQLQENMVDLYLKTGMFLRGVGGYYYSKGADNAAQENKWRELWRRTEFDTRPRYDPNNIRRTRAKGISGMAWGQGELIASPAAVARLVSAVSNHGKLTEHRYVLRSGDRDIPVNPGIQLTSPENAALLKQYMIRQSANKTTRLGAVVGGKSGTPERIWKGNRINDGWYAFFVPRASGNGNLVVCIRIESTKGSSDAVKLAGQHVIPLLLRSKYIKGISVPVQNKPEAARDTASVEVPEVM